MTRERSDRDVDRALDAWMHEVAPTAVPVPVLEEAFARTMAARQVRVYPWDVVRRWGDPWRFMTLVAAAAVVVAVGLIAFGPAGSSSGIGGLPSPAASATPSATPTTARPTPVPGYGTAPPGRATPMPLAPESPLPDPSGSPLPAELVGRQYNVDPPALDGSQALVLTLRAADDPHCLALFDGRSTCFTILFTPNWPKHIEDPGVRGPARIVDGQLVLGFALVPFDQPCEGTTSTYAVEAGGDALRGLDVPACSFTAFVQH